MRPWAFRLSTFRVFLSALALISLSSLCSAQSKLTPASLTFGSVAVGSTSASHTAIVRNVQKTPITITSIAISGGNAASDYTLGGTCPVSPNTLAASASCNITVAFTPSAIGNRLSTLTVTSNSPSSPQSIAVAGIGIAPATVLPASLTFNTTFVGSTSSAKTVALTNHLKTTLAFSALASGDFIVVSNSCGSNVAAGAQCTIGATFNPTALGARTGALTISYAGFASPIVIALKGTGNDTGLVSISVVPSNPSVTSGGSVQFAATGHLKSGGTNDLTSFATWTSVKTNVATITAGGFASAVSVGTSNIAATFGKFSGATTMTVTAPPTLVSIAVSPANPSVAQGLVQQFTATGSFSDGSQHDLTGSASWSSSLPAIASISTSGLATSTAQGATTISAAVGSISASTRLTVTAASLTSISVTPASVYVGIGSNRQYTATGTFSDGSSANLTNSIVWSTSSVAIATIGPSGLGTSTGNGAAQILATSGFISGSATMNGISGGFVSCDARVVDMKIMVLTTGQSEADYPAITQALDYIGEPYSVLDLQSTGNTIPAGYLSDGGCHGYFQGVISAFGNYRYNVSNIAALDTYESQFSVRQVNWFVFPDPNFGLASTDNSLSASSTPYNFHYAPAASSIFPYANLANPVGITNAEIYLTSAANGATPVLTDDSGNVLAAIYNTPFAGQYLSLAFDSNQYLLHDQVLAYGLVSWVTQGVFLGDYHVYASPQVDDFFIDDSEWIPGTSCQDPVTQDRTKPDASNLPVFRLNAADMAQLSAWQNGIQTDPSGLFSNFELTLAFNGVGTAQNGDWTGLSAPITATSSNSDVATFTTTDFTGLPGAQVTVTGTSNGSGVFNGTFTILSVSANTSTTPATTQFTATVTGAGTVPQQSETGATASVSDDLVANFPSYQSAFHWISHTYDHPNTLNGLTKSGPPDRSGDDIDLEVLTNLWVASSPGGSNLDTDPSDAALAQLSFADFNPANMVTPGVTGLNDLNVPGYLNADGIQYVVTDTSVTGQPNNGTNPSPNVGIVNSYAPGIYEVPRHPNDIYYNVANWNDNQAEFDCIYTYPNMVPPYNSYTAAQILNFVSSSFLSNMLIGDMDPQMFHQPDLHFSINTAPGMPTTGQTSALIADTYSQTFNLYKQVFNLPVLSPTLDQLGVAMQNRNAFNQSNVTASIIGMGGPNATITVTMPSSATVPTAVIPVTGLTSAGAELYGGQVISHIPLSAGQTVSLPLQ